MKVNWSLFLDVILLVGVFIAIKHVLKSKRKTKDSYDCFNNRLDENIGDDIISVRKVEDNIIDESEFNNVTLNPSAKNQKDQQERVSKEKSSTPMDDKSQILMIFLSTKTDQKFSGYELMQAILAAGLRFGEGNLFHKYQHANSQGIVMFSLAAATTTGTFDLQNIESFSVRGLCLYMRLSGNTSIDGERLDLMISTAKSLSSSLNANLLDNKKQPLSEAVIGNYYKQISCKFARNDSSLLCTV